eukprot:CAMPEP_0173184438 /NCGR_PEP_ID=MMETSP1141-20130122/8973_1 /TAXON_ID=483371 /ORGANISM="non described non described, Strain CCMP2298" /LENGTH=306 /DNA_ID=CAMNT_0014107803 /DNA_START=96 /DNA_END=1016 /DNA_ORIENTATION=-
MRVERDGSSNTITFHPDEGSHSATVVLMHGLGDSAEGLSDLAQTWGSNPSLQHIKVVLPTAGERSVTLNGGMRMNAWYDITGLDDRANQSCEGIGASVAVVRNIVEAEMKLGLPLNRILLSGFSQGGALALFAGLQLPPDFASLSTYTPPADTAPADAAINDAATLAGIVVLSGYMPGESQFTLTAGHEAVPVLHCHGDSDPVVRPDWTKKTETELKKRGMSNYSLTMYPGLGHSINPAELSAVTTFLQRVLPPSPRHTIAPKPPCTMSVKELKAAIRNAGIASRSLGFVEKSEFVALLEEHFSQK